MDRPPFYFTIDALRVDGDLSADPLDYRRRPKAQVIGQELVAFLTGHLASELAPRGEKGHQERPGEPASGMTWQLDHGVTVAHRPSRETLEFWSRVEWLTIDVCGRGEITPHEGSVDLEALARDFRVRGQRRRSG